MIPIGVVIDTREKRPWSFPEHLVTSRIGTLKTGDYALEDDDSFAIERKSLDDFLQTVSSGWERFLREIGRMEGQNFKAKIVIVEGDYESFCFKSSSFNEIEPPAHNHPRLSPQFVNKRMAELTMMNVSVIFAGCPEYAASLAYSILQERWFELSKRNCR